MARYIRDIELQLPEEEVQAAVEQFRDRADLYPTIWNGEEWFTADYKLGRMAGGLQNYKCIYFFRSSYENGVLHLEAWMREGKRKESNLTGWGALTMKQPFLSEILKLEQGLLEMLPPDSDLRRKNEEAARSMQRIGKRQKKGVQAIQVAAVLLVCWAFLECLRYMGIL